MRFVHFVILGIIGIVAIGIGLGAALGIAYVYRLPQVSELATFRASTTTRILDRNGDLLAELYQERRHIIPLGEMPPHLVKAILAVEDPRFYTHEGLDFRGIIRALLADIRHGAIKQGGSTITQQLARVLFLSSEKTLMRKVREALLAMLIERRYTKDEILWLYLNQIYLGSGAYGVQAAAQTYFSKNAVDLTLIESAMIAGLPQAPSAYTPLRNPARALKRRNHVLRRMRVERYIDQAGYEEARQSPLQLAPRQTSGRVAPYFVEMVRLHLESTYGSAAIYHTGLEVHTTLDRRYQRYAQEGLWSSLRQLSRRRRYRGVPTSSEVGLVNARSRKRPGQSLHRPGDRLVARVRAVRPRQLHIEVDGQPGLVPESELKWTRVKDFRLVLRANDPIIVRVLDQKKPSLRRLKGDGSVRYFGLEQEPKSEGAVVAIDPATGAVRAMVGGYAFARSQFNRVLQAQRQPGSAFKPIIFATAANQGISLADRILDTPVVYEDPHTHDVWKPRNFSNKFYGPISVREALEHSRNVATVKLLRKVGVKRAIELARKLGIASRLPPYLSLALGTAEVNLLELTSAYAAFANSGLHAQPYFITRVTDREGQVLEDHVPSIERAISPQIAYIMTQALRGVVLHGTGRNVRDLDLFLAGKTGTTNDYTNAWFIGFTPGLALGVWVGNDDSTSLGRLETGARAALPVWRHFFERYIEDGGARREPTRPDDIVFVEIDKRSGLLAAPDCGPSYSEVFTSGTAPTKSCREAHATTVESVETEIFTEERAIPVSNSGLSDSGLRN